jgi:hypothetical protein
VVRFGVSPRFVRDIIDQKSGLVIQHVRTRTCVQYPVASPALLHTQTHILVHTHEILIVTYPFFHWFTVCCVWGELCGSVRGSKASQKQASWKRAGIMRTSWKRTEISGGEGSAQVLALETILLGIVKRTRKTETAAPCGCNP